MSQNTASIRERFRFHSASLGPGDGICCFDETDSGSRVIVHGGYNVPRRAHQGVRHRRHAARIASDLAAATANMTATKASFTTEPTECTTLELGSDGTERQAALSCKGAGCRISLAGTATDSKGAFEAEMTHARSESTLDLEDVAAEMKTVKDSAASSLSLADTSAALPGKEIEFKLDGADSQASLKAGKQQLDINDSSVYSFTTKKGSASAPIRKCSSTAPRSPCSRARSSSPTPPIDAPASGTVSISANMVKIG